MRHVLHVQHLTSNSLLPLLLQEAQQFVLEAIKSAAPDRDFEANNYFLMLQVRATYAEPQKLAKAEHAGSQAGKYCSWCPPAAVVGVLQNVHMTRCACLGTPACRQAICAYVAILL